MLRIEPPFSSSACATPHWFRSAAIIATFAALVLGGTPEIVENAGSGSFSCNDDDDDARRARAARDARPSRQREVAPLGSEAKRADSVASDELPRRSRVEPSRQFGQAAFTRFGTEFRRRSLAFSLRRPFHAVLERAPNVSLQVEPAVGPDPPTSRFPTSAIPLTREHRAMDRASEAAARTARIREDRLRQREIERERLDAGSRAWCEALALGTRRSDRRAS